MWCGRGSFGGRREGWVRSGGGEPRVCTTSVVTLAGLLVLRLAGKWATGAAAYREWAAAARKTGPGCSDIPAAA